jgi:hypothetical protein
MTETPNFEGVHLWNRLMWAKANLKKVQPKYCITWEDPTDLDAPMKVTTPDPNWLAAALNGGILPDIEAYLADKEVLERYEKEHGSMEGFSWRDHDPQHPYVAPRGPMDEIEALEYIVQKDLPNHVWGKNHNRPMFKIVPRTAIPTNRTNRNAWRLNNLEMEAA